MRSQHKLSYDELFKNKDKEGEILAINYQYRILIWSNDKNIYVSNLPEVGK